MQVSVADNPWPIRSHGHNLAIEFYLVFTMIVCFQECMSLSKLSFFFKAFSYFYIYLRDTLFLFWNIEFEFEAKDYAWVNQILASFLLFDNFYVQD